MVKNKKNFGSLKGNVQHPNVTSFSFHFNTQCIVIASIL